MYACYIVLLAGTRQQVARQQVRPTQPLHSEISELVASFYSYGRVYVRLSDNSESKCPITGSHMQLVVITEWLLGASRKIENRRIFLQEQQAPNIVCSVKNEIESVVQFLHSYQHSAVQILIACNRHRFDKCTHYCYR